MPKVICDEKLCSGCLACVVACIDQHYDEGQEDAVSGRIYEKRTSARTGLVSYVTRSCLHCASPQCMEACRYDAIHRDGSGFVILDREKCVGCRACASACPHDVPRYGSDGRMVKCDGCRVRVACGRKPACVRACNTGALSLAP